MLRHLDHENRKKITISKSLIFKNCQRSGCSDVLFRLVTRWRNASDLQKLSNVGPMLGQRRHSDHDDRTKYLKKITNINPKNYIQTLLKSHTFLFRLAKRWRSAPEFFKLSNVGPTATFDDRKNKKFRNYQNMYI